MNDKEKTRLNSAITILNQYRNSHYNAPSGSVEHKIANAINDVLPFLVQKVEEEQ